MSRLGNLFVRLSIGFIPSKCPVRFNFYVMYELKNRVRGGAGGCQDKYSSTMIDEMTRGCLIGFIIYFL